MNSSLEFKSPITLFFKGMTTGLGWFEWLIIIYAVSMALDYLTGLIVASQEGKLSFSCAAAKIWHQVGSLTAVIVSALADIVIAIILNILPSISIPINYSILICPIVLFWYIINDLGSIIENTEILGIPIPAFLRKIIKVLKGVTDIAGNKLTVDADESIPNNKNNS